MRYGENPLEIINKVKTKTEQLEQSLPEGTVITPFYDRTDLIQDAIDTMKNILFKCCLSQLL